MVNNGYANPSSAKVPTFKQSLYIIHSMWSQIVSAFRFFLHSSLSCLVQPSNQSASCTLNEILLNFCILTWEKCKVEAESSSSLTSQLPGILGSMVFLIDLLIISAKIAQNHQKNNLLHCFQKKVGKAFHFQLSKLIAFCHFKFNISTLQYT